MSRLQDEAVRVSTLELFFDLVFVFTLTQLTTVLPSRPKLAGRGQRSISLALGASSLASPFY